MSRSLVLISAFVVTLAAPVSAQTPEESAPNAALTSPATSMAAPSEAPASTESAKIEGRPNSSEEADSTSAAAPQGDAVAPSEPSAEAQGTTPKSESVAETSPEVPPTAAPVSEEKKPAPYEGPATLLTSDGRKMHVGGYGGISIMGTSINKSGGLLVGGEGAILLDHRLAIGIAGYGLSSEVSGPDFADGEASILGFGYGGAVFRYHLVSKRSPVTASLGTLVGAGGLTLIEETTTDEFDNEYDYAEDTEASVLFVVEPSVQANLHLTKWMRFGVTGGYRFVRGPSLRGISDGDLEGVTAGGHLQFGWF